MLKLKMLYMVTYKCGIRYILNSEDALTPPWRNAARDMYYLRPNAQ